MREALMNLKSFFAELKRRNVYKVAVAYAVISWLLIQASSILFPTFDAPHWVMKVFVVVLVLGLAPALIFAWAFEITPEGIKRESEIAPNESIAQHTGRKIAALTVAVAVVAAGLFTFQLLRPEPARVAPGSISTSTPPPTPVPEKSIAVLPFANLSDDKSNAYFAEGIQDEILTRLSKIAALKVSPNLVRKSSMAIGHVVVATAILGLSAADARTSFVFLIVMAVGNSFIGPNMYVFAQTFAGPAVAGRWTGLQNCLGNLVGVVVGPLTGWVVDLTGHFWWAFVVAAAIMLLGGASWVFLTGPLAQVRWPSEVLGEKEGLLPAAA